MKTVEDDDSRVLNVGVHCAKIEIEEDGVVELASGVHYFLEGENVLLAFDKNIEHYHLSGKLDVSGLTSGPFQGFVFYHQDYHGHSNCIHVEEDAEFRADGVINPASSTPLPHADISVRKRALVLVQ